MTTPTTAVQRSTTVKALVESPAYSSRFQQVLKDRAPQFISSLIQISQTGALAKCDPHTVIAAAMTAAALDLPIDKNLGFAHIVPYKDMAQFQMGYKGFVQLGLRTGQYKHLNAGEVYDGELVKYDRIKGEVVIDPEKKKKPEKIVGYVAFMQLLSGYEHTEYWPIEKVEAHAKRFSKAYASGYDTPWKTSFDAMAKKTVIKSLLSHWGPLTVQMARAIEEDQAIRKDVDADLQYPDGTTIDVDASVKSPDMSKPESPSLFPAGGSGTTTSTPTKTVKDQPSNLIALRGLMAKSKISEEALLPYLREKKIIDESISSLEEMDMVSPSSLEVTIKNWGVISREMSDSKK